MELIDKAKEVFGLFYQNVIIDDNSLNIDDFLSYKFTGIIVYKFYYNIPVESIIETEFDNLLDLIKNSIDIINLNIKTIKILMDEFTNDEITTKYYINHKPDEIILIFTYKKQEIYNLVICTDEFISIKTEKYSMKLHISLALNVGLIQEIKNIIHIRKNIVFFTDEMNKLISYHDSKAFFRKIKLKGIIDETTKQI